MRVLRFSRRTVLAAIEVLEVLTQAKLSRYLLELGAQYPQWVGGEGISLTKRLNNLMQTGGSGSRPPDRRWGASSRQDCREGNFIVPIN